MFGTHITCEFHMKCNFVSYHFIVFDAVRIVETSPDEVKSNSNSNSNYFISLQEYGNNVIQHLSYNIINNFFNHRADRRPF